ncbi:prepilin-type N-terminal cleavage/methylation domain-containing protein [Ectothiorhodosinus mongolicus]|uniref:Prepilin-type N-terminal cleavage/methylation domain-containing protein n=1 Tax=Ectothiorhodosinus mongolicus TaxID=233100 RepID=A0A1R3VV14_9GAMM|nr:prepilin-type N-terminal cleavage/methylation domain-containing protein [Ectothiorhodosinus mongolicus]SIT68745.1 prepilin-type N-terminal cleavage/methylation domain-containing protein [Ectothiorhodosinus mongolicus]
MRDQAGFSLVEMLISLLLAAFLLAGALQLFTALRAAQNELHDLAEAQEVLAFSVDVLLREVRSASALETGNNALIISRQRFTEWCAQPAATEPRPITYFMQGEGLRCRGSRLAQELLLGFAPRSRLQAEAVTGGLEHGVRIRLPLSYPSPIEVTATPRRPQRPMP